MCLGGRTGLLLLEMVVRPVKSPSSSESGGISSFSSISSHSVSRSPRAFSVNCHEIKKSKKLTFPNAGGASGNLCPGVKMSAVVFAAEPSR